MEFTCCPTSLRSYCLRWGVLLTIQNSNSFRSVSVPGLAMTFTMCLGIGHLHLCLKMGLEKLSSLLILQIILAVLVEQSMH